MSRPSSLYGPLYSGSSTHVKVQDLAIDLDIPQFAAFGIVTSIWEKALTQCPTGRWRRWDARVIAGMVTGYDGDAGALLSALLKAGFLVLDGADLCIHDWMQYGGASIAARQAKVKATKAWRKKRDENPKRDDTDPFHDPGVVRHHSDISQGVGEPSSLLSSSLSGSDPEDRNPDPEIAKVAPEPPRIEPRLVGHVRLTEPRGLKAGVVGYPGPASVEDVLAASARDGTGKTIGEARAARFPSFGQPGAITLREAVTQVYEHWRAMPVPWSWPDMFISKGVTWISDLHTAATKAKSASSWAAKATKVEEQTDTARLAAWEDHRYLREVDAIPRNVGFDRWFAEHESTYRAGGSMKSRYLARKQREAEVADNRAALHVVGPDETPMHDDAAADALAAMKALADRKRVRLDGTAHVARAAGGDPDPSPARNTSSGIDESTRGPST